jgi:hypothetical protein
LSPNLGYEGMTRLREIRSLRGAVKGDAAIQHRALGLWSAYLTYGRFGVLYSASFWNGSQIVS